MAKKTETKNDSFEDFGMTPCVVPIEQLTPYARNSRTHSDVQIAEIAASIKEFGWRQGIAIDEDNTIRAGHGRYLAAQKLGLEKVPCLRGKLTETQWRAYVIADNRLAEKAGWDNEMLKLELNDLKLEDFDINLTGFDEHYLQDQFIANIPDEDDSEPKEKAFTVLVTLETEEEMEDLFNKLNDQGYKVKAGR